MLNTLVKEIGSSRPFRAAFCGRLVVSVVVPGRLGTKRAQCAFGAVEALNLSTELPFCGSAMVLGRASALASLLLVVSCSPVAGSKTQDATGRSVVVSFTGN